MFLNLQLRLSKWEQMVCMPNGTARPGFGPSSGFLQPSSLEHLQIGRPVRFQTLFLLVSYSWSWQILPSRQPEHSACPASVIKWSHHCCPGGRIVSSNTSAGCCCLHVEELHGDWCLFTLCLCVNCIANVTPWIEFCMAAGRQRYMWCACSAAIIGSVEITLVP